MKILKLISALLALGVTRLFAVSPVPYTEAVSFTTKINGAGTGTMTVYDESSTSPAAYVTTTGAATESAYSTAWLIPGKQYIVNFTGTSAEYWMSLTAPQGYETWIEGSHTDLIYANPGAGSYNYNYHLVLRPVPSFDRLDAGVFTGIDIGKSVSWEVGLGGLKSGNSVGRIGFRQLDLSASPANRSQLIYNPPAGTTQVTVVRDGASNQVLRQVGTPQTVVDLLDDAGGGYWIKFYAPSQATYASGSYTFSGSPWRTIRIESPTASQFKVTETVGSFSRVSVLTLTSGTVPSGTYVWTLQEGDGTTWLRTTTHTSTNNGDNTRDDVVAVLTGSSGSPVAKTKYRYKYFSTGWEEVYQVVTDPDAAALTTTYDYYTSGAALGNYRRVKSVVDPTGNWSASAYYDDWNRRGRIQYQYQPYGGLPSTVTLDPTQGHVTNLDYGADWTGRYTRPTLRQESINNVTTAKETRAYDTANNPSWSLARDEATVTSYSSASATLTSRSESVSSQSGSPDETWAPYLMKTPNQGQVSFSRSAGDYSSGTFTVNASGVSWRELKIQGSTSSTGADAQSSYNGQNFDSIYVIANKSALEETIRDVAGNVLRSSVYAYTGSSTWVQVASTTYTYDSAGRQTQSVASNGSTKTYTYTNGLLTAAIGADGVELDFTYDTLGRTLTSKKVGVAASGSYAAQADVTTTTTYDGANHVTATVVGNSSNSETVTTAAVYDLSGRVTSQTPPGLGATTTAYMLPI